MKEILKFFKEIFMLNDSTGLSIGLSQFKTATIPIVPEEKSIRSKDIKLSDLMRRN